MKRRLVTLALILSIPITAIIGAGSIYFFNEILQTSHRTTYSKEKEIEVLDRIIEMADKNEIEPSEIRKAFISQKKSRIAAHNIMNNSQDLRNNAIVVLFFTVILQMSFLYIYMKKDSDK